MAIILDSFCSVLLKPLVSGMLPRNFLSSIYEKLSRPIQSQLNPTYSSPGVIGCINQSISKMQTGRKGRKTYVCTAIIFWFSLRGTVKLIGEAAACNQNGAGQYHRHMEKSGFKRLLW